MELNFRVYRDTDEAYFIDTEESFFHSVNSDYEGYDSVDIEVFETVHDENHEKCEEEKKVALLSLYLFDETRYINDPSSLLLAADSISGDATDAMVALLSYIGGKKRNPAEAQEVYLSSAWEEDSEGFLDENKRSNRSSHTVYIDQLYVYPEYRNKGVATYLLDNLSDIILHFQNTYIRCATIIAEPQNPITDGSSDINCWENTDNDEMRTVMVHTIENNGFFEIGENIYMRNYGPDTSSPFRY